ncbi:MAG TPA: hypothetical protein EYP39_00825 [Ghiorsea sp.]|nr:hypothetical protein [Ghiorsea sp.]HIP06621.1 hypothetical protein [Mariprofundaceae bacterium]
MIDLPQTKTNTGKIGLLIWLAASLIHFLPIPHDYIIIQIILTFALTMLGFVYLIKYIRFVAAYERSKTNDKL